MLNVVTPCMRPENLIRIYQTINFNFITKWYICYDTTKVLNESKMFDNNPHVVELFIDGTDVNSMFGNQQRNMGLKQISKGYVYFLDDDNVMHPDFYKFIDTNTPKKIYTFDRLNNFNIVSSGDITNTRGRVCRGLDTSQFCVDIDLITTECFLVNSNCRKSTHNADTRFISSLIKKHPDKHIYIYQKYLHFITELDT